MVKVMSFFSEKGGVGKSVHTVLFADYLAYHCGCRVAVIDLESPSPRLGKMRLKDEYFLGIPDSPLSRYVSHLEGLPPRYEILTKCHDYNSYTKESLRALYNDVAGYIGSCECDYVLMDFPGLFIENCPAFYFLAGHIADLVMIPTNVDDMSRSAAAIVGGCLRKNGVECMAFWNDVSRADILKDGYLEGLSYPFVNRGIPVHPVPIKSFAKAKRDAEDGLFVRNTVCWPQRYVEMACPELPVFYADIKRRLDGTE